MKIELRILDPRLPGWGFPSRGSNLAAGLDARPYRMDLPPSMQWMEIDFPEIISYKQEILSADQPRCHLERVALDLSQVADESHHLADQGESGKDHR